MRSEVAGADQRRAERLRHAGEGAPRTSRLARRRLPPRHLTIEAAGGTIDRRVLYRASSMQVLGSVINGQLGVAARIAALRRSSPAISPQWEQVLGGGPR